MFQIAKKNMKNYVIKLSTTFSVVTEFTSFVAVEKREEVYCIVNCSFYWFTSEQVKTCCKYRISYPASAEIRPYFHIRPRPDMAAGYEPGFDLILIHLLHCLNSLKKTYISKIQCFSHFMTQLNNSVL